MRNYHLDTYALWSRDYGPSIQVGSMRGMFVCLFVCLFVFFLSASNTVTGLKRGVIIGHDVHIIFSKEIKAIQSE